MIKLQSSILPGDLINDDVWIEIFKRLPIKTLGLLRCVCNYWNSIIQSHYFLLIHHRYQIPNPNPKPKFWMRRTPLIRPFPPPHLPDSGIFKDLPYPLFCLEKHNHPLIIVDEINGVVCIRLSGNSRVIVLYNPTMNKYARIPDSPFKFNDDAYTSTLGFGFNKTTHDLCLLNLYLPIHEGVPVVYELFSVKNGTWRKVVVGPLQIKPTKYISFPSFFVNGTIHWIICESDLDLDLDFDLDLDLDLESESESQGLFKMSLVMFHCELEEWRVMPMPERFCEWITESNNPTCSIVDHGTKSPSKFQFLFNHQGMLGFFVSPWHMCVMKEFGDKSFIFIDSEEGFGVHNEILLEESLFFMKLKMPLCNSTRELKRGKGVPSRQDNATLFYFHHNL